MNEIEEYKERELPVRVVYKDWVLALISIAIKFATQFIEINEMLSNS